MCVWGGGGGGGGGERQAGGAGGKLEVRGAMNFHAGTVICMWWSLLVS